MATDFEEEATLLSEINVDSCSKRETCSKCKRPSSVCWCPYLPSDKIDTKTTVYILQHPYEEKRRLKTVPMLKNSLLEDKCKVYKGKKFPLERYEELKSVVEQNNTLLLFPSEGAVDLEDYISEMGQSFDNYNIVLLDGTWLLAKGIFFKNMYLQNLKQVKLKPNKISEYVIRTQPTENSLSTLETAAIAISILENRKYLYEILVKPLKALCDFQIAHGAVRHQSKQYLLENGLYKKQTHKHCDRSKKKNVKNDDLTFQDA